MATETLAVSLLLNASQYKREALSASTATGQISSSTATAGTATGKLQNQMSGLAATAKFAVAGAAAGAVIKFGKDSVQAFLGFDDAMNQSLAIMGDVSDEMRGKMSDAAREVGKTTRISAEEAAEAYFFLASAGLDAEQSIAAMPQVAAFAQAGMFDMATATDLATDAQSALGLTVDDAGQNLANLTRVTDVFTKANVLANTSVQQVAEAMTNKAGPAMRDLGMDIEEGAAVLAVFGDQGIKGAEAGTQFGIVLRDLQTKALANKNAFEEAGVAVFDSNDNFRNMADIIGDLEGAIAGMSDAERKSTLLGLGFSDKSVSAIQALLGTSDAIREYESELRKAGGTTQEVADNQLESFQGKMDLLKGRLEDVQITVGEALVPVLLDLANTAMPIIEIFGTIAGVIGKTLGPALAAVTIPFKGLGAIIGHVGNVVDFVGGLFGGASDKAEEAGESFEFTTDQMQALRGEAENVGPAAEEAGQAVGTSGDRARIAAERFTTAAREMRDLANAFLEAADPAFAAAGAVKRYQDALEAREEIQKDVTSSEEDLARANLDVAEAALQAQGALNSLDEGGVVGAISTLAAALDVPFETAQGILETLGLIDGLQVNAVVRVSQVGHASIGGITGGITERHSGGPVTAGVPYIVRPDEELFIPSQNGYVSPMSGMAATSTGPTYNIFTLTYDDFVRESHKAGVLADRLGW